MCLNIPISVVYVYSYLRSMENSPFDTVWSWKNTSVSSSINEFAGGSWDGTHLLTMDPNFRDHPNTLRNFQCDLGSPSASQYAKGMTGGLVMCIWSLPSRVQRHEEAANSRNLPVCWRTYLLWQMQLWMKSFGLQLPYISLHYFSIGLGEKKQTCCWFCSPF